VQALDQLRADVRLAEEAAASRHEDAGAQEGRPARGPGALDAVRAEAARWK
jgi:hypothetical protein